MAVTAGILAPAKHNKIKLQRVEGTMFNWKIRYAQEIFGLTLAIGTLLALASVIPA
jgi:hypothetical protein